eukprot:CAMPEP_0202896264 /NCGR_PEP_ID=MMETSP1392-20130828/5293_1 /ASSEMBLY_ACC=CAM_ASM_000868 /TAXON_ID=225041 /ORGANISM="Chlamydomonas chlamydogama, Strain SAG 11-48b" /LENGTH=201 /DNA_ID=CAMNT_0049581545 /DNA_START=366 /DNA_END=968 /DNA_ORIENTATION=+
MEEVEEDCGPDEVPAFWQQQRPLLLGMIATYVIMAVILLGTLDWWYRDGPLAFLYLAGLLFGLWIPCTQLSRSSSLQIYRLEDCWQYLFISVFFDALTLLINLVSLFTVLLSSGWRCTPGEGKRVLPKMKEPFDGIWLDEDPDNNLGLNLCSTLWIWQYTYSCCVACRIALCLVLHQRTQALEDGRISNPRGQRDKRKLGW